MDENDNIAKAQEAEKYKPLLNQKVYFCLNDKNMFSFYFRSLKPTDIFMAGLEGQGRVYKAVLEHIPKIHQSIDRQEFPQSVLDDLINKGEAINPMNPSMKYKLASKPVVN